MLVVTNPSWITPPRPEFPAKARAKGIAQGTVAVRCMSSVEGRLADCVIHAETPAGAGFGEASLAATQDARLSPRMVDGRPTTGKISYTNRFHMQ